MNAQDAELNRAQNPPRLNVEIREDQSVRLSKCLPHGMRKVVFGLIVDDLCELIEGPDGHLLLGAFLKRRIKLGDFLDLDVATGNGEY